MSFFFFFNDTATTEIYTLSLHDALPIFVVVHQRGTAGRPPHPGQVGQGRVGEPRGRGLEVAQAHGRRRPRDRKSTRLNSSHANISYAVFCLKKKKHYTHNIDTAVRFYIL